MNRINIYYKSKNVIEIELSSHEEIMMGSEAHICENDFQIVYKRFLLNISFI